MLRGSSISASRSSGRLIAVFAGAVIVTGVLAGCTQGPQPVASSSAQPSPSATPSEPTAPQLIPDGSAADNLPLFTEVIAHVWAGEQRASGRAYIDALVEAGFDKERMQVTEDRSTVGNSAESLQFSVAWGERECLVGQAGPSTGEHVVTVVMDQLAGGRCLVGNTRPIDW